jgi:hypothetical protein
MFTLVYLSVPATVSANSGSFMPSDFCRSNTVFPVAREVFAQVENQHEK